MNERTRRRSCNWRVSQRKTFAMVSMATMRDAQRRGVFLRMIPRERRMKLKIIHAAEYV